MRSPLLLLTVALQFHATVAAARPLVAVIAANEGTEITDFIVPYAVLVESGAVDVVDVAVRSGPVSLMPALRLEAKETIASFDAKYPDGADYVVVPAVHHPDDPELTVWLQAQAKHGATMVGICDGVWAVAHSGLVDERSATGHWYSFGDLESTFTRTRWVRDRRYVRDGPLLTTTGVSASLPASLALVEEIAGRERAAETARNLGASSWGAEHDSARYHLDARHVSAAAGNLLAFWRWERVGIPISPGVDEMSLGFTADAQGRTYRSTVLTTAEAPGAIVTRRGLRILPDATASAADLDRVEELPGPKIPPAKALDHALARIEEQHGAATARFVALQLEYAWP